MAPIVTLLTDFGTVDSYVAEVKAVLLTHCPDISIVDVTHQVPPYDVQYAAFQLLRSFSYFPAGTFHMVIVDPGVGSARRCLYVKTRKYHFLGPDNGALFWAVQKCVETEQQKAEISEIPLAANTLPTFHGRDVFAPFLGRLLSGLPTPGIPIDTLAGEKFPIGQRKGGMITGTILAEDHFGNLVTSVPIEAIRMPSARIGRHQLRVAKDYESISKGQAALIAGSHGFWEISCRCASAARLLKICRGKSITMAEST